MDFFLNSYYYFLICLSLAAGFYFVCDLKMSYIIFFLSIFLLFVCRVREMERKNESGQRPIGKSRLDLI